MTAVSSCDCEYIVAKSELSARTFFLKIVNVIYKVLKNFFRDTNESVFL